MLEKKDKQIPELNCFMYSSVPDNQTMHCSAEICAAINVPVLNGAAERTETLHLKMLSMHSVANESSPI